MTTETLTITHQNCTYIAGYLHIQLVTEELCHLTLITTQTKPTRKHNPAIQEPGMRPHRWLYLLRDIVDYSEETLGDHTVHQYLFPWPDLNDTLYFTAVHSSLPRADSPQGPIFAWRMPLTLIYSTLWPDTQLPPFWSASDQEPDNSVSVTPGRMLNRQQEGPFSFNQVRLESRLAIAPAPANQPFLFVLLDPLYTPLNANFSSYYGIDFVFSNNDLSLIRYTSLLGAYFDDPCDISPTPFFGTFDPHKAHLFALDLYTTPTTDLCGNPAQPIPSPYIYIIQQNLTNYSPAQGTQVAAAGMRPFAIYSATGQMQDISRHWISKRTLLPQTSTPRLQQPK